MVKPSLDELLKRINSRYGLVITAAKRARLLMLQDALSSSKLEMDEDSISKPTMEQAGGQRVSKKDVAKPVTRALEEIAADKIGCKFGGSGAR